MRCGTSLELDPSSFLFLAEGPGAGSDILQQAFSRYSSLTFPYKSTTGEGPAPDRKRDTDPYGPLKALIVYVSSASETQGLATDESYTFNITSDGSAYLSAATVFGALRGLESFSQWVVYDFYLQQYTVQPVVVIDEPRFQYRGIMLDVSRHFIPVPGILNVIDAMSFVKLNVLHLHLIDTQSWPIVVPEYPRLSHWGAYSNFSHTYSPDDIANIVNYAHMRGVRVIPEIDTPAHSDILTRIYPEYMTLCDCDGQVRRACVRAVVYW